MPDTWPSTAKQQRMCKRGEPALCVAAGAPGCELCMPCRYSDEQLKARSLPVAELRGNHAKRDDENPLHCSGCFNARPRPERESLVVDHLASHYQRPDTASGVREQITRIVADFDDTALTDARDWSAYQWHEWMDANLPPVSAE